MLEDISIPSISVWLCQYGEINPVPKGISHLNICSLSVLDPVCKYFVLRFNRKVVLPDGEAEQC